MDPIQAIMEQLTLEEKAALCTGATAWTTTPLGRLGVPAIRVSDGPHGLRRVPDEPSMAPSSKPATCFPTASCLASTWDTGLIHQMGQALAEEAIALDVDVVLGPGVNMKRTPLCGRNFEYFSEDPYLAGELAASLINGVQSRGVGTSLKHYAANNPEYRRMTISAQVDERTLREIYLPAFETAVKKGKPWTVMCAYNRLNGTYGSENRDLLTEILRREWGFEGFVVSDWSAVHDRVAALRAGLDLQMPGPRDRDVQAVIEAVRSGQLDEGILDEAVRRILRIAFRAARRPKSASFDLGAHHALARKIAGGGMVLLKNNGILPMKNMRQIAVIGRAAQEPYFQGGGSSHINPTQLDVPLAELEKMAGGARITYREGYSSDGSGGPALIAAAVNAAQGAEVALLYMAPPPFAEAEGYDRADIDLTNHQVALIQAVTAVQPKAVVILNNGSAVAMSAWLGGAAAVLEAWMMGQAGGGAIAEALFGLINPSGKLPETFPLKLADTPAYLDYPGDGEVVRYGEGLFVGYRYYEAREQPVLFPFGHGLSYTTFEYRSPEVSSDLFRDVEGLTVSVRVTNTGPVRGEEVVQVYVHDCTSGLMRPPKELKGFAKVELLPGETKTVAVFLDERAFAYYHPVHKRWITENGEFDILIGASSADIRCRVPVTLKSTLALPCLLDGWSTVGDWLQDPRGKAVFDPLFREVMGSLRPTFGSKEEGGISEETMTCLRNLPLRDLLRLPGVELRTSPEDIVESLLEQARS
jgi:beta-glucosidase